MRPKLNLITLGVKNFARSLDFFETGLGWKKSSASQDDVAFFPMQGIVFGIYPLKLLAIDAKQKLAKTKSFSGITLAINVRSEKEVDTFLLKVKKLGGKIVKPGQKVFWGGYSGYFSDPDGHIWEVAHNPFFKFDKNGNLSLP
ncbi:MAG: VOC family protein [Leptospira sp.]|nr:VOC family protein [Leptospira sp.]